MRVSEGISVTMRRVLVLVVAAVMAAMLSFSVSGITASPAEAHTVPACYKSKGAAPYKNPHCKKGHDKKHEMKKDHKKDYKKKYKKNKKHRYSY